MDYSFPHYLLSKQTVDDRALNRHVYETLVSNLPDRPVRIIEVGAGIGTMPIRLLRWGLLKNAEYIAVDAMPGNIDFGTKWILKQTSESGLQNERLGENKLRIYDDAREVHLTLLADDVFAYIQSNPDLADLLIAHAFLDLVPLPDSLPKLFSLLNPGGLAWLTINFDGVTIFEPTLDPQLDADIERSYHRTMDDRPSGGGSQTGRLLFSYLRKSGVNLLASGASDWVVHAVDGSYPGDEAYFLNFILHFFEQSLAGSPELDPAAFSNWLSKRQRQVDHGELIYIAHQLDFLIRT
jgi:hypothetical protein